MALGHGIYNFTILDKNCANFKCKKKLDFIYSHAKKIYISIKKRWLQKIHYISYKFINLKYRKLKKKNLKFVSPTKYRVVLGGPLRTHQIKSCWYLSLVDSGTS